MEKTQRMLDALRSYKPGDDFIVIHYTGFMSDLRDSFTSVLMQDRRMPRKTVYIPETGTRTKTWPGISATGAVRLIKSYHKSKLAPSGFRLVYHLKHTDPKVLECIQTLVPEECREEV